MRFDTVSLQAKINITEVISRYRSLVRSGKSWKILCPFHNDHTPSMTVDPDKNFCWCFACQNGGDMFSFVQKIEGVSFPESVEIIAEMANVSLDQIAIADTGTLSTRPTKEEKDMIRLILEESIVFFQEQYQKNMEAKEYVVHTRKINDAMQRQFCIGYAPKSFDALMLFLTKKGYSKALMAKSGMLQEKESGKEYDRFRDRVMFPLWDAQGRICGFAGRSLHSDDPKYLNSPETLVYKKSETLFGFHFAKQHIRQKNFALLVEGNLDVITCHQYGFCNTVGVSGVGFSQEQAKLLKRVCTQVVLGLDDDEAGQKAMQRMLPVLFAEGFSVRIMHMPAGKDPDEALHENPTLFSSALETAQDALCFFAQKKIATEDSLQQKRIILNEVFPIIKQIPFALEQKSALQSLAPILGIDSDMMHIEWQTFLRSDGKKIATASQKKKVVPDIDTKEYFWGYLLSFFQESGYVFSVFSDWFFEDDEEKKLYNLLSSAYNDNRAIDMIQVLSVCSEQKAIALQKSALYCHEKLSHLPLADRQHYFKKAVQSLGKVLITQQMKSPHSDPNLLLKSLRLFQ